MREKQGEAAAKGILAGYGSNGDEEENDDEESPGALVGLGQYEESEDEGMPGVPIRTPWMIRRALIPMMNWSTLLSS